MIKRLAPAVAAAFLAVAPAHAAAPGGLRLELAQMMGRWYEVARVPNVLQNGCYASASTWTPTGQGFAVVQSCRKGSPDGPVKEWRAKATVADPATNTKFKMTFFGGLVSQDYLVLDHRPEQGWLILGTANGRYMWLMSQKPVLPANVRAQAINRIRQLGFDPARLEFPAATRG